jgi:hypothetical protein
MLIFEEKLYALLKPEEKKNSAVCIGTYVHTYVSDLSMAIYYNVLNLFLFPGKEWKKAAQPVCHM